jgi:hypothetical protein
MEPALPNRLQPADNPSVIMIPLAGRTNDHHARKLTKQPPR